jgi:hypothetical protein
MAGEVLVDVEAQTEAGDAPDPLVSLKIALDPGSYRLALAYEDGRRVEQTLIASPGWQTEVYLLVDGNAGKTTARADLINSSITMRRLGEAFGPDDPKLRREEIARGALQESRKILSPEIRSLITSESASPMLALIGAHLLIREANEPKGEGSSDAGRETAAIDNRDALGKIVENLRLSIGKHPDVEAVANAARSSERSFVFDAPPMFRASWPLLLQASIERPDSIPASSINALIAERIWGEGPWLFWLGTSTDDKVDRAALWQTRAQELLLAIRAKRSDRTTDSTESEAETTMTSVLTSGAMAVMREVKAVFTPRSRTPFPDLRKTLVELARHKTLRSPQEGGTALTDDQRAELVQRLGIPLSSIDAWLRKIGK